MATKNKKTSRRLRIKKSIRRKISGVAERPRLTVFKSNRAIYAQLIDDVKGVTLASASTLDLEGEKVKNTTVGTAQEVGKILARKAKEAGVEKVVFDRNGYIFHGKVKALADGAREEGLIF